MMKTKSIEQRLTEVKALVEGIERDMKQEPVSDGLPAMGQTVFIPYPSANVLDFKWSGSSADLWALETGNIFLTRESAEREVERRKVVKILRDMAGDFKPDWTDENQQKFYPVYCYESTKWDWQIATDVQYEFTLPHFGEREAIESAITHLGDRLNVLREG